MKRRKYVNTQQNMKRIATVIVGLALILITLGMIIGNIYESEQSLSSFAWLFLHFQVMEPVLAALAVFIIISMVILNITGREIPLKYNILAAVIGFIGLLSVNVLSPVRGRFEDIIMDNQYRPQTAKYCMALLGDLRQRETVECNIPAKDIMVTYTTIEVNHRGHHEYNYYFVQYKAADGTWYGSYETKDFASYMMEYLKYNEMVTLEYYKNTGIIASVYGVDKNNYQRLEENRRLFILLYEALDEPGTDEPGTDEPGTDEPGTDEPGTEE